MYVSVYVWSAHQFIVSSSVTNELETANDNNHSSSRAAALEQKCAPSKYISSNKRHARMKIAYIHSAIGNFPSISKLIIHSHGDNCFTVCIAKLTLNGFHNAKLKRRVPKYTARRSCHIIKFRVCVRAYETLQIKVHVMSVSFAFNIQSISTKVIIIYISRFFSQSVQ